MAYIDLTGHVAIVTGAGGGLGRSHALALAERGAAVVVNDLGGAVDGTGSGTRSADVVVEEIVSAGGRAVANYDGVHTDEGGQAIVATAVEHFGGLDIVVNNAGILRDKSFKRMDAQMVDAVLKVHLYGAFNVTRAAWQHLVESPHGRVIMTSSGSGLYGNFGQANYAAAKMGLVGLTRTLAIEGARDEVRVNAIAPLAASRMTEEIMPADVLEKLDPRWVSPLVTYLASPGCTDSGQVFSVAGGYYARVAIVEGPGVTFTEVPSAEDIARGHERLTQLDPYIEPTALSDQIDRVVRAVTDSEPMPVVGI